MKTLVTTAFLALAATPASAQVYGTNDDPYSQNPFASGMNLPDPVPATAAPAASTAPPRSSSDSVPNAQDSAKTQQTTASSGSSSGGATTAAATKPPQP